MGKEKSDLVRSLLLAIGENPDRTGLKETPDRVVKSWAELYSGYGQDPKVILKTFDEGVDNELVVLKDIEWFSSCEHHLLPFYGHAHIGYIPNKGRVVGVSKLARVLDIYSRRLQIQERLGQQVTQALMDVLKPKAAGCILSARHLCMTCRGVGKQNSVMLTSSLRGVFLTEPAARDEFLRMCGL
jgi:GTP cyclohydrolase IA